MVVEIVYNLLIYLLWLYIGNYIIGTYIKKLKQVKF